MHHPKPHSASARRGSPTSRVRPDLRETPYWQADPEITDTILSALDCVEEECQLNAASAFDEAIELAKFQCETCEADAELVVIGWRSWTCHECFIRAMQELDEDWPSLP